MLIVETTEVIHFKRLEIVMAHVNVNMHEFKIMLSMYIHVAIGVMLTFLLSTVIVSILWYSLMYSSKYPLSVLVYMYWPCTV